MPTEVWIVIGVIAVVAIFYIATRNSMISLRNLVDEAWSGIDVQLKRRHDLVPNLVETVKGYATHERETFERTAQARADAMRASNGDPETVAAAEARLSGALANLRAVAENYPELRATENFRLLQRDLAQIEDEIQASRRIYNSRVQTFNTRIQIFPNSLVAGTSGMSAREFFEIGDPAEREPVAVDFD